MTIVNDTGVLICGHGGREADTLREFLVLSEEVASRLPQFRVEHGFLEFSTPSISGGLEKLRRAGCKQILVIPGTLFSGGHAQRDIPAILQEFTAQFPYIDIRYGRAFDVHSDLVRAACERVRQTIAASPDSTARENTALVVVGRGASEPAVLASMLSIVQLIQTELKFAAATIAYAGIAQPSVAEALEQSGKASHGRVVVLPYFLFTGRLVQRLYDDIDAIAAKYPHIQFLKCPYLNNHPSVIDAYISRILEISQSGKIMHV